MKTKEQVLQHLMEVGYTKKAINKIMGFLIGKDLNTIYEQITYKKGEENFEYFMNWFNSEEKTKLEAYKEIVDFFRSTAKDIPVVVPSYWLEYLNNDIKMLDMLSNPYTTKLNKEHLDEIDRITEKAASEHMDLFKGLEILFRK